VTAGNVIFPPKSVLMEMTTTALMALLNRSGVELEAYSGKPELLLQASPRATHEVRPATCNAMQHAAYNMLHTKPSANPAYR
jgi:hypothetical protein